MLTQISLLALALLFTPSLAQGYGAPATSSSGSSSTATSAASSSSTGTVYDVDVGDGSLNFSPDTVTAEVGDTINFHFYPRNHSVVQSSFNAPCVPLSGSSSDKPAIYSGFMPVAADAGDMMFSVMVNSTNPIWLYCSQGNHCQSGMSMVVNPPDSGPNTLDAYMEAAKGVQTAMSPSTGVAGGVVLANVEGDAEESGSSSNSTASASSGSTTGSKTGSATAGAASASATGAAAGMVRPFAAVVAVGMLVVGLAV